MKIKILFSVLLSFIALQVCAKDFRFVQVTDLRYSKNIENKSLDNFIADINKQKDVEFVVFTGDNIEKPSKDNLSSFLKKAKKLKVPFYVVIGDKDVNKRKELSKKEYSLYVHKHVRAYKPKTPNYIFEKNGIVFMVADGAKDVIPSTIGYYKDDVLEWVDANLELYPQKPVIILQHFPLIPPAEKESYYTFKSDKYLEILSKHKNVKAIISGHFGVNKEQTVDGIAHVSTAPFPQYRIIDFIDYDTNNPTLWAEIKEAK